MGSENLTFLCFFFFVELTSFSGSEISIVSKQRWAEEYLLVKAKLVECRKLHDMMSRMYIKSHANLILRQMTLVI